MTGRKKEATTKLAKQNELSIGRVIPMEDTYTATKKIGTIIAKVTQKYFRFISFLTPMPAVAFIQNFIVLSGFVHYAFFALLDCCWHCANVCLYLCLRWFFFASAFSLHSVIAYCTGCVACIHYEQFGLLARSSTLLFLCFVLSLRYWNAFGFEICGHQTHSHYIQALNHTIKFTLSRALCTIHKQDT